MAFLAPGDTISAMASQSQPQSPPASSTPQGSPERLSTWEYMTNRRSRKQASIFVLGATLFMFSTLLTKRSLQHRRNLTYPLFYKPSNAPLPPVNGPLEAFRALQLATANVTSVMFMVSGGLLWAFDISSVDDLRARIRAGVGAGTRVKSDVEIEREFEQWLAARQKRKANDEQGISGQDEKGVVERTTGREVGGGGP